MLIPYSLQNLSEDTIQRFREIVQVLPNFSSPHEEEDCRAVVLALNDEECLATAKISYAYWVLDKLQDETFVRLVSSSSTNITHNSALKVARWHVQHCIGSNRSNETSILGATEHLKEALKLRNEHKMELFRTCFDPEPESEEEISLRADVQLDLEMQLQVLLGSDKEGRAVVIKMSRQKGETTEQAYIRQQLYLAERSTAVTEYISRGRHDTTCAIFNLQHQSSSMSPAVAWQVRTIKLLQTVAPGRMAKLLVIEPPFLIRQVFNVIKAFLSTSLQESVFLVSGKAKTQALIEQTLASPCVLSPDGSLATPAGVDIEKYLFEIPFYLPYDYKE